MIRKALAVALASAATVGAGFVALDVGETRSWVRETLPEAESKEKAGSVVGSIPTAPIQADIRRELETVRARLFAAEEERFQPDLEAERLAERRKERLAEARANVRRLSGELSGARREIESLETEVADLEAQVAERAAELSAARAVPDKAKSLASSALAQAGRLKALVAHQRELRDVMAGVACGSANFRPGAAPDVRGPESAETARVNDMTEGQRKAFATALMAYECERYEVAFREWFALAAEGVPSAKFHVGGMLLEGRGVSRDADLARAWLEAARRDGVEVADTLLNSEAFKGVKSAVVDGAPSGT